MRLMPPLMPARSKSKGCSSQLKQPGNKTNRPNNSVISSSWLVLTNGAARGGHDD
jgi:hypothetical protein